MIDFSQYTEYVTEGPVVHPVALEQHDLGNPYTLAALQEGYAHVTALGRAPVMDATASDRLKAAASEVYHTDVVEHEVVSDRPAEVVARLLWVRDRAEWWAGMDAERGAVYWDQGTLWRCLQSHRTQADWRPGAPGTDALWTRYYALNEVHEWIQPLGAEDAWALGSRVTHNGHTWTSLIANNVWEPGAVGSETLWRCEDCDEETPTCPEYQQPTGAHDAYNTGDCVVFEGNRYESLIDANVWSPAAYPQGWRLIGPA